MIKALGWFFILLSFFIFAMSVISIVDGFSALLSFCLILVFVAMVTSGLYLIED